MKDQYCCTMRRHFLVGIVGVRKGEPTPIEAADFVIAWEPKILIKIKYCPFCGKQMTAQDVVRSVT